jgi:hypothetical protein
MSMSKRQIDDLKSEENETIYHRYQKQKLIIEQLRKENRLLEKRIEKLKIRTIKKQLKNN